MTSSTTLYEISINKIDSDQPLDFSSFKGKKVLVVNVASKCGYTKQYAGLEELYKTHGDKLVVVGVPCNQFLGQEPGSEAEIVQFCSSKFDVTFPLTTKVDVKGVNQHPLYKWLTTKSLNGLGDFKVSWNFNKFLVDENGHLEAHFGSNTAPLDTAILNRIH